MVDSEYSPVIFKPLKINIGAIIKNRQMLKFISVQLETKKLCKYALKTHPQ